MATQQRINDRKTREKVSERIAFGKTIQIYYVNTTFFQKHNVLIKHLSKQKQKPPTEKNRKRSSNTTID